MALNPPNLGGVDPYNPPGTLPYVKALADDGSPAGAINTDTVSGNPVVAGLRSVGNPEVDQSSLMVTPSPAAPTGSNKQEFGETAPFFVVRPAGSKPDQGDGLADQPLNANPDYVYLH